MVYVVVTVSFQHKAGSKANCLNNHICSTEDRKYKKLGISIYIYASEDIAISLIVEKKVVIA